MSMKVVVSFETVLPASHTYEALAKTLKVAEANGLTWTQTETKRCEPAKVINLDEARKA